MKPVPRSAKLNRIEWSALSYYLVVCHTNNLSQSAHILGYSRSNLSERLSKLEEVLSLPLFERLRKRLYVNEQGLSLGKFILPALILEHFATHYQHDLAEPIQWLEVKLPLRFYGGRLSRALENAIQTCQQHYPNILIWPLPYDGFEIRQSQTAEWLPKWSRIGEVHIDWAQQLKTSSATNQSIAGGWCLLSHESLDLPEILSLKDLAKIKLSLPRLPWILLQQIASFIESANLSFEHITTDYRQILSRPNDQKKSFLVNRLLIDKQVLASDWRISQIEAIPHAFVQIQHEGQHPVVETFIHTYLDAFQSDLGNVSWIPKTQLKHWGYLHQTIQAGSISTAAESLFMTQSNLSIQLKQLEYTLGYKLLQRKMGVRNILKTEVGEIYFELCKGMQHIFTKLFEYCDGQRLNQQQHLSLGLLPSIDSKSTLVQVIANQVNEWQQQNPQVRLEIVEERHRYLVDALRNHELHLAIIEADSPWVSHVPIQKPESMGLVIHPTKIDATVTELDWRDLSAFQLVLPRKGNGMRLLIDQHCLSLGIELQPEIQSDSLNINQHWIIEGRYASILPKSAVSQLVEQGKVRFIELKPNLNRILRLAYLSHRILSPIENSLLQFLLK
ncbi:hypothetical protein B9T31_07065 [Acinetobacter sp. ANC 4558]|uniref:LysR substrate-binding domain-containing protein n=1 Tax=Acinetobacter sp. ANC 4558 TaxID=1977876 RepID=UPI000A3325C7|nr:LysR substrate-binding domain-containing protein [Acinetobacter sp. ANC 4558]OTG86746.1 hypothetical protein B9T31_07065 [Acinetobacter sp. ANC 4558]